MDDRIQTLILVGYHSIGVYKLFFPNDNKAVISIYVEFDDMKGCNWIKIPSNRMQEGEDSSHIKTTLHDDKEITNEHAQP